MPVDATPVLIGLAVAVVVALRPLWRGARNGVTFVHETGHALVALACGARVQRIRLRVDTSGDTSWTFRGNPGRLRRFAVAGAGYPAAPLAGLGVALAVFYDHAEGAMIVVAAAWLVVSVIWVRSGWGVVCALAGVAVGAAAWWFHQAHTALDAVAWLWLLGGLRASWEVIATRPRRGDASDPGQMAAAVPTPAPLWAGFFILLALATALFGAALLLRVTSWRLY
jgi:hypothetical protein